MASECPGNSGLGTALPCCVLSLEALRSTVVSEHQPGDEAPHGGGKAHLWEPPTCCHGAGRATGQEPLLGAHGGLEASNGLLKGPRSYQQVPLRPGRGISPRSTHSSSSGSRNAGSYSPCCAEASRLPTSLSRFLVGKLLDSYQDMPMRQKTQNSIKMYFIM